MTSAESAKFQRIIVISDIHSNLPALTAVLREVRDEDLLICAGDVVGYYTEPNEVCSLIRHRANFTISGNHDLYVGDAIPFKPENEFKYRVNATREELTHENFSWLKALPRSVDVDLQVPIQIQTAIGRKTITRIRVAHGSPDDVEEYVYPDRPVRCGNLTDQTLLILGHTHHPMFRVERFGLSLNPGSVGQPRDWNPRPSFAVVDMHAQQIQLKRTNYDWKTYSEHLRDKGIAEVSIDLAVRERFT